MMSDVGHRMLSVIVAAIRIVDGLVDSTVVRFP